MWAMVQKEFRQLRRDRRTVAMMIVMPLVLLIVLSLRRMPPFLTIFSCAIAAGVLAWFTQPAVVAAFAGEATMSLVGWSLPPGGSIVTA